MFQSQKIVIINLKLKERMVNVMNKIKMNVQGRVQGVGFRYMTKLVADQLGVTGTIKNEEDGSVTIEAAGEEETIKKFIEEVKKSPSPSGRVQYIDLQENPLMQERKKFDVIG
ncbi:acylphosphatase [Enterococcus ratti]|uniref:acylphosphatase n=2 Tax=Enterococcus ratti TaxID=150033 RepID=A0A1L8WPP4_9ENTE|nr:acylphosphatase [Enterococcus ratti]